MTLNELNSYKKSCKEIECIKKQIRAKAILNCVAKKDNTSYGQKLDEVDAIVQQEIHENAFLKFAYTKTLTEFNKLIKYICSIPDNQTRLIFYLRFVEGLKWNNIADQIGGNNTEDSVKKRCYRYIKA